MLWWSFLLLDSPCLGPGCWSQCSVRHERFLAVFRWQVYARASQAWDLSVWWWLAARLPKLSPYFCVLWAWLWCDAQLPSNQSESRVQPGEARLTNGMAEFSVLSPNHNTFHSNIITPSYNLEHISQPLTWYNNKFLWSIYNYGQRSVQHRWYCTGTGVS